MATTKMTFTVDDETLARLERTAARLGMSKSGVVREAIREYAARVGQLSEAERVRMLAALDEVLSRPATRSAAAVDREIDDVRASRRGGGRRSRSLDR